MFRKTTFEKRYSGDRSSSSNGPNGKEPKIKKAKPPTVVPPTAKPSPVDPLTGLNTEQVEVLDTAASQVRATINAPTAVRIGPIGGLPESDQGVVPVCPNQKKYLNALKCFLAIR